MKARILRYEELRDSREILELHQPPFATILIYFIFLAVTAVFIWLWFGEIDVVVKCTGIVRTIHHVSVVWNINEGVVAQLQCKEGQYVKQGDLLYRITNRLQEIEYGSLWSKKQKAEAEIALLSTMEASVLIRKNYFWPNRNGRGNEYFTRCEAFLNKYEQLRLNYQKAQAELNHGKKLGIDLFSQNDLDQLERNYQLAQLELNRFQNEMVYTIRSELQTQKDQLQQVQDALNPLTEKLRQNQVRAPISGVVQLIKNFNRGDFIQGDIEVLRIVPQEKSNVKVELTVANQDIGLVKKGQAVTYRFLALPFKEYGVLTGTINVIATDVSISESVMTNYRVEGTVAESRLYDKKGLPSEVKVGMLCNARIIVKRKKLFYLVLEKLDFR